MNDAQQLTSNRLWTAVLNLDLQLYKASIYKQRWGTPGGNDQAQVCYDEALRGLAGTSWPVELQAEADDLARRVRRFKGILERKDSTSASAEHTRLMYALENLRESVRHWPAARPAGAGHRIVDTPSGLAMDELIPGA